MEEVPEVLPPQNPAEVIAPNADVIEIPKAEYDDIKHRADVSSQNFERLKKAEEDLAEARAQLQNNFVPSDPDNERVTKLEATVSDLKTQLSKSEVIELHPMLKEMWSDLESFRADPENKGMNLRTAAKAFLVEKGLLDPQRKGLERSTGGGNVPVKTGMNAEDVKKLRETNFKKYSEMVRKGQIEVSE